MKSTQKSLSILVITSLASLTLMVQAATCQAKGANGNDNSVASDLMGAFQTGCSLNGSMLQLALNQTQNFSQTVQDLQKNSSCAGITGALSTIQNLQSQISSVNNNAYASQISNLSAVQQALILQINQTTDPTTLSTLGSIYGSNLLDLGEAQGEMASSGLTGQTSLQTGSLQLQGYLSQLLSDQTNITQCANDNPAMGAQLGAGMLAVAGSFIPSVAGTALSLAGNALNAVIGYIHSESFAKQVNTLNQVQMVTALPCGLEQMTDVYCQAQDIIDITQLEECAYNPSKAGCQPASPKTKDSVTTTQFWQGLDVLERELPALQLWINQAVTGITPASSYSAQQMNDAATSVYLMDSVSRLAQGVMNAEATKIAQLPAGADQDEELRNGLAILETVLANNSTSTGCLAADSYGGGQGCTQTPIFQQEGSATQLLYDLVGRNPSLDSCNPISLASTCSNAASINLTGVGWGAGANDLTVWTNIENNAGGLPTTPTTALNLIGTTLNRMLLIEDTELNTDPSDLMEKLNVAVGEGLPSAIKALGQIDTFLKSSFAYFSDKKQVPDSMLDGGAASRTGILGLLKDSETMIEGAIAAAATVNGTRANDLNALTQIYTIFQLASDRNFIFNRISDQIKLDVHTRITAGQVPTNIYDILSQSELDPTVGLTQTATAAMETTMTSLGTTKDIAQLNVQDFATFFSKSINSVLALLKSQADANGEPQAADPAAAPNRAGQARICLLLASSQNQWPAGIDSNLCKGLSYGSTLTGQSLSFDTLFAQLQSGSTKAPQRMCTFYHFYRESQNYTHEKQQ